MTNYFKDSVLQLSTIIKCTTDPKIQACYGGNGSITVTNPYTSTFNIVNERPADLSYIFQGTDISTWCVATYVESNGTTFTVLPTWCKKIRSVLIGGGGGGGFGGKAYQKHEHYTQTTTTSTFQHTIQILQQQQPTTTHTDKTIQIQQLTYNHYDYYDAQHSDRQAGQQQQYQSPGKYQHQGNSQQPQQLYHWKNQQQPVYYQEVQTQYGYYQQTTYSNLETLIPVHLETFHHQTVPTHIDIDTVGQAGGGGGGGGFTYLSDFSIPVGSTLQVVCGGGGGGSASEGKASGGTGGSTILRLNSSTNVATYVVANGGAGGITGNPGTSTGHGTGGGTGGSGGTIQITDGTAVASAAVTGNAGQSITGGKSGIFSSSYTTNKLFDNNGYGNGSNGGANSVSGTAGSNGSSGYYRIYFLTS